MLLQPRQVKFKKIFNCSVKKKKQDILIFGEFGLKSQQAGIITAAQLESAQRSIAKLLKKLGLLWIRVFPSNAITKKPSEIRMGKGKGPVDYWSATVYPGTIIFEISGVSKTTAFRVLKAASNKLALKSVIISKGL